MPDLLHESWLVLLLSPLVGAAASFAIERHYRLTHWLLGVLAGLNVLLVLATPQENEIHYALGGLGFTVDRFGWFFALLINLSLVLTLIYSYAFTIRNFSDRVSQFYLYLYLAFFFTLASGLAANLPTLLTCYGLSIPFSWLLIRFRGADVSGSAGRLYLLSTLGAGLLFLLPTVLVLWLHTGHLEFNGTHYEILRHEPLLSSVLVAGFVLGFSTNAVFPFHGWLPRSAVAPAPASALINSAAAVNIGTLALIKIGHYVFGPAFLHQLSEVAWQTGWLIWLCGATAVYAAWRAWKTTNLKERFAWSTVSQMSYILMAVLIGTPELMLAGLLHMFTHALAKMGLFYVAGLFNSLYGTVDTRQVARLAPHLKWVVAAVAVFGLSIIGFPLLAGSYSKDLMLLEEIHTRNYLAAGFLVVGSLINVLYIWPIVKAGFFTRAEGPFEARRIPRTMRVAIGLCVLLLVAFSFYSVDLVRQLHFALPEHLTLGLTGFGRP